MQRDADGKLHLGVFVFGAWSPTLDHDLSWLVSSVPPSFAPRRRMVERGWPWFSLVRMSLPVAATRPEPVELHIASITGTVYSEELEAELFAAADGVVFAADTTELSLHLVDHAREKLDAWMVTRSAPVAVFQLDTPNTTSIEQGPVRQAPPKLLDAAAMCARLRVGDRSVFETRAYCGEGIYAPFRAMIRALVDAESRGELAMLRLFDPAGS